jgi:hypothetical protein
VDDRHLDVDVADDDLTGSEVVIAEVDELGLVKGAVRCRERPY